MSIKNILPSNSFLDRLLIGIENAGLKKWGRNKKIAEITGYSQPQVSAILSGKEPPSDRFVKLICLGLLISEDWIRTGQGEPFISGPERRPVEAVISDQHIANGYDLPPDEQELLQRFRRLDKQHRLQLLEIAVCYEGFCGESRHAEPLASDSTVSGFGLKSSGVDGG